MSGRRTQAPQVAFSEEARQRIRKARIPLDHRKGRISIAKVKQLAQNIFDGCTEIILSPFADAEEGFSGALLLRVDGKTAQGYPILPCILKVASKRRIKEEFRNFQKCVDLVLDNAPQVYRDGYKNIEAWAGIAYTKIGGRWDQVKTFKALYSDATSEGDLGQIRSVLRRLFEEVMYPWHEIRRKQQPIWKIYHLEEDRLKEMAETLTELERKGYELGRFNPIEYWKDALSQEADSSPPEVCLSTIHGDLNSRNILFNTKEDKPYLIDFSETGWGHSLRDLAKLEADIKFVLMDQVRDKELSRLPSWLYMDMVVDTSPFGSLDLHPLERKITDKEIRKAYDLIRFLRRLARERISSFPPIKPQVVAYRVALLHYTLKKLTLKIDDPKLIFAYRSAVRLCQFQLGRTRKSTRRVISQQEPGDDPKILLFLWLHGTYECEWAESVSENDLRKYFCVCGCIFEVDTYRKACEGGLKTREVVDNGYTRIISVAIRKQEFAMWEQTHRREELVRLGLGAALQWFGEYLLVENKKGRVVVGWKGEHEQQRTDKVYGQICEDGTELRSPSFFQHLLSGSVGFEKPRACLGIRVAKTLADVTKRDILREGGVCAPEDNFSSALQESYWAKVILPSE